MNAHLSVQLNQKQNVSELVQDVLLQGCTKKKFDKLLPLLRELTFHIHDTEAFTPAILQQFASILPSLKVRRCSSVMCAHARTDPGGQRCVTAMLCAGLE
jgi:hypothetical protein